MYVCVCSAVTESQVRAAIAEGTTTIRDLRHTIHVTRGCAKCVPMLRELLAESGCLSPPPPHHRQHAALVEPAKEPVAS